MSGPTAFLVVAALLAGAGAPHVTVAGPRDTTQSRPTYRFSGARAYVCAVDRAPLRRCPARFRPSLAPGMHLVRVQGIEGRRRSRMVRVAVFVRLPVTGRRLRASGPRAHQIPVGQSPFAVLAAGSSIWTANFDSGTVSRLDPGTERVTATIRVRGTPAYLAYGHGSIWVGNDAEPVVTRIDPQTNAVIAEIATGARPSDVAVSDGAVWVSDYGGGTVTRIDPATNAVVATVRIGGRPCSVVVGGGVVWAGSQPASLVAIDPATNRVTRRIRTDDDPDYLLVDGDSLWVSAYRGHTVQRYALATLRPLQRIRVGGPEEIELAGGSLWAGSFDDAQAVRIDVGAGSATAAFRTGAGVRGIEVAYGSLWTADSRESSLSRIPLG